MITSAAIEQHATPLARVLAQRQVDPNEVAKSFAHMRALYERAGGDEDAQRAAVDEWWRWLATVAGPGARAVVRSGRTQDYYRTIQDACRYHLREIKNDPAQLVHTLGWAVRLMRYYRNVPGALDRPTLLGDVPEMGQGTPERKAEPARPPEPPRPKAPELPAVGAVFTGTVLQIDESAVVVEVPGFAAPQVLGVIKADDLAGRKYREGNTARVEVTGVRALKSGRTIVELRPARREGDPPS
jgi:hypothetical protein